MPWEQQKPDKQINLLQAVFGEQQNSFKKAELVRRTRIESTKEEKKRRYWCSDEEEKQQDGKNKQELL